MIQVTYSGNANDVEEMVNRAEDEKKTYYSPFDNMIVTSPRKKGDHFLVYLKEKRHRKRHKTHRNPAQNDIYQR